jgi:hypothetical protein
LLIPLFRNRIKFYQAKFRIFAKKQQIILFSLHKK